MGTVIGTPYYMSPELVKNKPYDYKSDVWALGCVLYEMTTLKHAFDANSLNGLAGKIVRGKYPPIPHQYSQELRQLIAKMLSANPSSRPTLTGILKKPFLRRSIRRYIRSVIKNFDEGICSQSSYDNFQEQIKSLGYELMLQEIQQKVEQQKQPTEIEDVHKQLEEEEKEKNKIEQVLKKLREERRWRIEQRRKKNPSHNKKRISKRESNLNNKQNGNRAGGRPSRIRRKAPIPKQNRPSIYKDVPKKRYGVKPIAKPAKKNYENEAKPSARKPTVSDLLRKQHENESSKREVENLSKWEED